MPASHRSRRTTTALTAVTVTLAVFGLVACSGDRGDDATAATPSTAPAGAPSTTAAPGVSTPSAGDPVAATTSAGGGDLFVVEGTSGTAAPDGEAWDVSMVVDADVLVFTDRPARGASRISAADLVEGWTSYGFDADPPNAALTATTADGDVVDLAVELTEPRWDDDTEHLTVTARPIGADRGAELPSAFDSVRLFVDDATEEFVLQLGNVSDGPAAITDVTSCDSQIEVQDIDTDPVPLSLRFNFGRGSQQPLNPTPVTFTRQDPGQAGDCRLLIATADTGRFWVDLTWPAGDDPSLAVSALVPSAEYGFEGLTVPPTGSVPVTVDLTTSNATLIVTNA